MVCYCISDLESEHPTRPSVAEMMSPTPTAGQAPKSISYSESSTSNSSTSSMSVRHAQNPSVELSGKTNDSL